MICNDLFFFFLNFLILKVFHFVAIEKCVCVTKLHNWCREPLIRVRMKTSQGLGVNVAAAVMSRVMIFTQMIAATHPHNCSKYWRPNQSRNDFECSYAEPLLISLWRILAIVVDAHSGISKYMTTIKREIII